MDNTCTKLIHLQLCVYNHFIHIEIHVNIFVIFNLKIVYKSRVYLSLPLRISFIMKEKKYFNISSANNDESLGNYFGKNEM